eukprot:evm.model.scf_73.14 EVM.evm.TU.scf_73.14   scf_73:132615-135624(+)
MACASSAAVDSSSETPDPSTASRLSAFLSAFWKFLRPHTIRGTFLGSVAVTVRALLENPSAINWDLLPRAVIGVLALICGNGYIVGINQIYDVEIDEVNKPFLPIAARELSRPLAWFLVLALAGTGVGITAQNFGSLITQLYVLGLFLGTVYSVPPFRLKRFAIPAFLIIATVRGVLLNFGVYYATRAALRLPFEWSPAIGFITVFVTVFAAVIAITKDLTDVKGDLRFRIKTFATELGVRNIAFIGAGLLICNYLGAVVLSLRYPALFNAPVMIGGHVALAVSMLINTLKLDAAKYKQDAIMAFYRWIWSLFYSEYILLLLI